MRLRDFKVIYKYQGGLTLPNLANSPRLVDFGEDQDMCFLQIGGNDLCDMSKSVADIATAITSFAEFLLTAKDIKLVITGQILRREPWAAGEHYNTRAGDLNDRLHAYCQTADCNMKFWHHYGFWDEHMSYLSPDGVHLVNPRVDARPMQKYLRSIRCEVLHFAGQLQ